MHGWTAPASLWQAVHTARTTVLARGIPARLLRRCNGAAVCNGQPSCAASFSSSSSSSSSASDGGNSSAGCWQSPQTSTARFQTLHIDQSLTGGTRQVQDALFVAVHPSPLERPNLVLSSPSAFELLGLQVPETDGQQQQCARFFSGGALQHGLQPLAHNYCGYQYGLFAGQLGDGRVISLGHVDGAPGVEELQLKGIGPTPFSRDGDGRMTLVSCLREFLAAEHLHALGIPTARGVCVVASDTRALRMGEDHHPTFLPAACSARVAPTFLRFGSFEVFNPGPKPGPCAGNEDPMLFDLLDHVIDTHFPTMSSNSAKYLLLFREIVHRTARTTAKWMAQGFVHGVLNTDNMNLLGYTFDYGPFGFMEHFSKDFTPNTTDVDRMYSYQNQPSICLRNLFALAKSIEPALPEHDSNQILMEFNDVFQHERKQLVLAKFGVENLPSDLEHAFWDAMESTAADFASVFRFLTRTIGHNDPVLLAAALSEASGTAADRLVGQMPTMPLVELDRLVQMYHDNRSKYNEVTGLDSLEPVEEEVRKYETRKLLQTIRQEDWERHVESVWSGWTKEFVKHLDAEALPADQRLAKMRHVNPRYILRAGQLESALAAAEEGDYTQCQHLHRIICDPYDQTMQLGSSDVGKRAKCSFVRNEYERPGK